MPLNRAKLAEAVRVTANGAAILSNWLGSGGVPVPEPEMVQRATVCADCPKNEPIDWTDLLKGVVGKAILAQEKLRFRARIDTPLNAKLGVCRACRCYLRLKIWVPNAVILARSTEADLNKLDPRCWVLKSTI